VGQKKRHQKDKKDFYKSAVRTFIKNLVLSKKIFMRRMSIKIFASVSERLKKFYRLR